jgi:hypothetical protein
VSGSAPASNPGVTSDANKYHMEQDHLQKHVHQDKISCTPRSSKAISDYPNEEVSTTNCSKLVSKIEQECVKEKMEDERGMREEIGSITIAQEIVRNE